MGSRARYWGDSQSSNATLFGVGFPYGDIEALWEVVVGWPTAGGVVILLGETGPERRLDSSIPQWAVLVMADCECQMSSQELCEDVVRVVLGKRQVVARGGGKRRKRVLYVGDSF